LAARPAKAKRKDKARGRVREKARARGREKDKARAREKDKARGRERDKARAKDRDKAKVRGKGRGRDKGKGRPARVPTPPKARLRAAAAAGRPRAVFGRSIPSRRPVGCSRSRDRETETAVPRTVPICRT
jgi:hypothetical protein